MANKKQRTITKKALKNFSKLSGAALESFSQKVASSMKGNKHFKSPTPTIKTLETALDKFSAASVDAKNGDREKAAIKGKMATALKKVLSDLADYVNFIAKGDSEILLSSGFDITGQKTRSKATGALKNFKALPGANSGEIVLSIDKVTNAKSYIFSISPAPLQGDVWKTDVKDKDSNTHTFTELVRGKEYAVRAGVMGMDGVVVFTNVILIIAN